MKLRHKKSIKRDENNNSAFLSLRSRLGIAFIFVGIVSLIIAVPYVLGVFNKFVKARGQQELNVRLSAVKMVLQEKIKDIANFTSFISSDKGTETALSSGLVQDLTRRIRERFDQNTVDQVAVINIESRLLVNTGGDNVKRVKINDFLIEQALSGKTTSGIMVLSREEDDRDETNIKPDVLAFVSVSPVILEGDILGAVIGIKVINENSLLLWEIGTKGMIDFAVLHNQEYVLSNIGQDRRKRTRFTASSLAMNQRMEEMEIDGKRYFVRMSPVKDINNQRVGDLAVVMDISSIAVFRQDMIRSFLLIGIIAVFIALAVSVWLSSIVTRPISIVNQALLEVGKGNLNLTMGTGKKAERGVLSETFNHVLSSIRKMLEEVKNNSERVNNLTQLLSSSTEQVSSSIQEVVIAISQISKGATDQISNIESTVKTVNILADSVKRVSVNASEGAKISGETQEMAAQGREFSQEAVDKTSHLKEVAEHLVEGVERLKTRYEEISSIVGVITSIADQTNLLALNAAIEAARAGSAGRGFAVVADEVRKLAESSGKSAQQIGGVISSVQEETAATVDSVRMSSYEVDKGRVIIERVKASLSEIVNAAESTAYKVNDIFHATEEQLVSTATVNRAIEEVHVISKQFASYVDMVSDSIEGINASMQEMVATSQELATLAVNLQLLGDKFKVEEEKIEGAAENKE